MKKGLILIVMVLALISCEKETFVEYRIDNQTSGKLIVSGTNHVNGLSIYTQLLSGERSQIAIWSKRELLTDALEPIVTFDYDLSITKANGATTTKNYLTLSNWTADIQNDKKSSDHVYTLVLTDDDF